MFDTLFFGSPDMSKLPNQNTSPAQVEATDLKRATQQQLISQIPNKTKNISEEDQDAANELSAKQYLLKNYIPVKSCKTGSGDLEGQNVSGIKCDLTSPISLKAYGKFLDQLAASGKTSLQFGKFTSNRWIEEVDDNGHISAIYFLDITDNEPQIANVPLTYKFSNEQVESNFADRPTARLASLRNK